MIRDLIRHSAIYTVANLFSRAMVFVWLLVLPQYLNNEQYGFLGLLTTFATLFSVLFTLEISQGLARYTPAADLGARPPMVSTGWKFTLLGSLAALAGLFLASPELAARMFGATYFLIPIQIGLVWLVSNNLLMFLLNQLRWEFRAREFFIASSILATVSIILSIALATLFPDPLAGAMMGQLAGAVLALAYCMLVLWQNLWAAFDTAWLRRLLRFSLPLVPASLSLFACAYANRLIVADTLGLEQVGLFTWANQLSSIPGILVIGIQSAITPLIIRHHHEADTPVRLARAFEMVFASGIFVCAALALGSPLLIWVLSYEQFAAAPQLVALSAPGLLLLQLYVFFPGFAIAKRTELQLLASMIGGLSVFATYPLIASFGIIGAAIGALFSGIIFLSAWVMLSRRYYSVPVRWTRLILLSAAAAIAVGFALFAETRAASLILSVGSLVLISVIIACLRLLKAGEIRRLVLEARKQQMI